MVEKPFSFHEHLASPQLEAIKKQIVAVLAENGIEDMTFTPLPDGTGFRLSGEAIVPKDVIFKAIHAIQLKSADIAQIRVDNQEQLIIDVVSIEAGIKPIIH